MSNTGPAPDISGIKSASVTDAMGRLYGHRAHILDLVSPTPGRVLFGPAVTISYMPLRQDLAVPQRHNFARLFYEAVAGAPAGKVLVIASNGHPETSLGGGTKLSRLHHHGLAGLLCDGRLRDFDELEQYDFASYCKGTTVRWGGSVLMPFAANLPIAVDGVTIVPGDYVYADAAAAVVIPAKDVQSVVSEALKIEAADAGFIETIRAEDPAEILRGGSEER